jgi:predicted DNA-binding transcriptional regulator YafY
VGETKLARWTEKVRYIPPVLTLQPPGVTPEVLAGVQEALLHEHQIEVVYLGPQDRRAKTLTLNPLVLVQRGPVSYLVASAFGYDDVRLYALHRMSRPHQLEASVRIPVGFSIDAYLQGGALDFGLGRPIKLKVRVREDLAYYLTETPLAADQRMVSRGGGYELTVTMPDSWQLRFWILSQGDGITVLSPAFLRRDIQAQLKSALAAYQ